MLTLLLVALLAGCGVPGPTGGTAQPPAFGPGGGLAGGAGFAEGHYILGRSDAELAAELSGIAATGARYVRVPIDWWVVQPYRNTDWQWGEIDRIVDAAHSRGLTVLGLIAYTPPWARPAGSPAQTPPTNPADYARFARAAAQRYAPRGLHDWEIWNEPNLAFFWQPRPDPAAYTRLLIAAYDAIKSVDPGATVMTGGLSPAPDAADGSAVAPVTFLRGIYAAGGGGHFDAVAHHPSNYPFMPLKPEANYNDNAFGGVTPVLRQTMVENGDSLKRIWATEMGAPTVQGMTPDYLARYITEAYAVWESWPWTGPLLWYSYRDGLYDPVDKEANFGLVRADGTPKQPALDAFVAAVR
jgi:polysaccharide biosynthesis protein PslG